MRAAPVELMVQCMTTVAGATHAYHNRHGRRTTHYAHGLYPFVLISSGSTYVQPSISNRVTFEAAGLVVLADDGPWLHTSTLLSLHQECDPPTRLTAMN